MRQQWDEIKEDSGSKKSMLRGLNEEYEAELCQMSAMLNTFHSRHSYSHIQYDEHDLSQTQQVRSNRGVFAMEGDKEGYQRAIEAQINLKSNIDQLKRQIKRHLNPQFKTTPYTLKTYTPESNYHMNNHSTLQKYRDIRDVHQHSQDLKHARSQIIQSPYQGLESSELAQRELIALRKLHLARSTQQPEYPPDEFSIKESHVNQFKRTNAGSNSSKDLTPSRHQQPTKYRRYQPYSTKENQAKRYPQIMRDRVIDKIKKRIDSSPCTMNKVKKARKNDDTSQLQQRNSLEKKARTALISDIKKACNIL